MYFDDNDNACSLQIFIYVFFVYKSLLNNLFNYAREVSKIIYIIVFILFFGKHKMTLYLEYWNIWTNQIPNVSSYESKKTKETALFMICLLVVFYSKNLKTFLFKTINSDPPQKKTLKCFGFECFAFKISLNWSLHFGHGQLRQRSALILLVKVLWS